MLISSMRYCKSQKLGLEDYLRSKLVAARLLLDMLACTVVHEERILIKLLEVFDLELKNVADAIRCSEATVEDVEKAKIYIEKCILDFMEKQSYMTAVTLLERFSIHLSGESFLLKMVESSQFKAAEKWASFVGRPLLCLLVKKYVDIKMLKYAYEVIKRHNLIQEFPDVYHLYKISLLKKFAEKGHWDLAELKTNNDRQLIEYLVYLALEAGYNEKVDELCERYSLQGFAKVSVPEKASPQDRYLQLDELILDDIVWVDEINELLAATEYIEGCRIIGLDSEWKPNYEKGRKYNQVYQVSIMQIASENRAFIFDLIKLYEDEPKALDCCFKRIFSSSNILKLGYNFQCDLHQLSYSYGDLECFKSYEMLLDIEKLFKGQTGGLSGLAKKILGAGLNKTRRSSNWEQRPLSQNQKEYAALDAVVLVHIFLHVRDQNYSSGTRSPVNIEWKSHIVSKICSTGKTKSSSECSNENW